jgi:hypothetical protein
MNGPEHYKMAERLLDEAARAMPDDADQAGFIALILTRAAVHARLASVAAVVEIGELDLPTGNRLAEQNRRYQGWLEATTSRAAATRAGSKQ